MGKGTNFTTELPETPPEVFLEKRQQEQLRQVYNAIEILRQKIGDALEGIEALENEPDPDLSATPRTYFGNGDPSALFGTEDSVYLDLQTLAWWKRVGPDWINQGTNLLAVQAVLPTLAAAQRGITILSGNDPEDEEALQIWASEDGTWKEVAVGTPAFPMEIAADETFLVRSNTQVPYFHIPVINGLLTINGLLGEVS